MISTSGSGQMLPIPMNEFMQQNFKAVGMDVDFDVVEWGTMLVGVRSDTKSPQSHGVDGINISLSSVDPSTMFRYYSSDTYAPNGFNWGHFSTPESDALLHKAQATFDEAEQTKAVGRGAHHRGGPGGLAVHRARPQPAGDGEEGDRVHSGAELVCRSDHGVDGVT